MKKERLYSVILGGLITEKTARLGNENRQIYFKVAKDATKKEIKEAVSKIFKVEVVSVKTINVKGKVKRFKRKVAKQQDWKKAVVCLAEANDINMSFNV